MTEAHAQAAKRVADAALAFMDVAADGRTKNRWAELDARADVDETWDGYRLWQARNRLNAALACYSAFAEPVTERMNPMTVEQAKEDCKELIDAFTRRNAALAGELAAANERIEALTAALREVERHCPCGARPESLNTHPHVTGCPVGRALENIS